MAANPQFVRLVQDYSRQREAIIRRIILFVLRRIRMQKDWYSPDATTALIADIVRLVFASQRQIVILTDAYLAKTLSLSLERSIRPVGPVPTNDLRRGVTLEDVYGRLADNYRWLRSTGLDDAEVLHRVSTRAKTMVHTDNVLAFRAQKSKVMNSRKEIIGWRRVIHPEISLANGGEGTCALCVVAADRVYKKEHLLEIHGNCNCTVAEIIRRDNGSIYDPGHDLNQDDLNELYALAGGNTGKKLKRVRGIAIHQHGELGPVLTYKGQHFRDEDDIPA